MSKAVGKKVSAFLRLKETKQYISLLETRYADSHIGEGKEILRIVKGGNDKHLQGTWMHQKLALKFAGWLSPEFELWVYDRIEELLTNGITTVNGRLQPEFIRAFKLLYDKVQNQEFEIENLKGDLDEIKGYVQILEEGVVSVDEGYYTITAFCRKNRKRCSLSEAQNWGKKAAALSRHKGYAIGSVHNAEWIRVGTYHEDILEEIILGE